MKTLDEQIDDIEKLDALRQRARTLRQEAIEALTASVYLPRPRNLAGLDENDRAFLTWKNQAVRSGWELPGDDVEKAEVLRAWSIFGGEKLKEDLDKHCNDLVDDLSTMADDELSKKKKKKSLDNVPVFRYAMVLQALAKTPGQAFSKTSLHCYDRIVRELDQTTAPAWVKGAARASERSHATAFVTGECARALLALETVLLQSADAAKLLGKDAARQAQASAIKSTEVEVWRKREEEFRKYSLKVSLKCLPFNLISTADLTKSPSELLSQLVLKMDEISKLPKDPPESEGNRLRRALKIKKQTRDKRDLEEKGRLIAKQLKGAATIVRDKLRPTEQFAETVINREIASADRKDLVDGAELVFAATLLGLTSNWKRPKVRTAWGVLRPLLSTDGRLLSIRPFDVYEKGYRLNAATLGVAQHIAELLANVSVEPEPEFIERLMLPFEYTRADAAETASGWTTDPPPRNRLSLWWLTAVALDALDAIVRMLNATINRRVLQNFQVRQPGQLKFKLDDLFYPDYGLATYRIVKKDNSDDPKLQSVAVTLQRLRAHVAQGPSEEKPLYSLILYGPPGTGKSTLVEAIAHTANVQLVEVTPSDILVGGAEGMERRAREVFQMLAKLTHVVILFDEFDSILLDRSKRDPEAIPTSVVEFLTPGMLPKLKALNNASKEGRISYVLATNFVDRLDPAATRGGRFDHQHGLFPPDPVSRLGRLRDQLKRQKLTAEQITDRLQVALTGKPKAHIQKRIARINRGDIDPQLRDVVLKTSGGPMDKIGRKGWFTMPDKPEDFDKDAPFGCIFTEKALEPIKAETTRKEEAAKYNEHLAKRTGKKLEDIKLPSEGYWDEWRRIEFWDSGFTDMKHNAWQKVSEQLATLLRQKLPEPEPSAASTSSQRL